MAAEPPIMHVDMAYLEILLSRGALAVRHVLPVAAEMAGIMIRILCANDTVVIVADNNACSCENIATGEMLRHPQDYDRMIAVLPVEYWPRFITDLTPDSPAQDALFSAGKE